MFFHDKLKEIKQKIKKNIFVSLKKDYAFTQVMKQPKVIKCFLISILHIQPERIRNIRIKNRYLPKDLPEEKLSILDLYTIIEDIGKISDIPYTATNGKFM